MKNEKYIINIYLFINWFFYNINDGYIYIERESSKMTKHKTLKYLKFKNQFIRQ